MFLQIVQDLTAVVIGNDFFAGCRLPGLCQIFQNTLCPEKDLGGGDCFLRLLRSRLLRTHTDADQGKDSGFLFPARSILPGFFDYVLQSCQPR